MDVLGQATVVADMSLTFCASASAAKLKIMVDIIIFSITRNGSDWLHTAKDLYYATVTDLG